MVGCSTGFLPERVVLIAQLLRRTDVAAVLCIILKPRLGACAEAVVEHQQSGLLSIVQLL